MLLKLRVRTRKRRNLLFRLLKTYQNLLRESLNEARLHVDLLRENSNAAVLQPLGRRLRENFNAECLHPLRGLDVVALEVLLIVGRCRSQVSADQLVLGRKTFLHPVPRNQSAFLYLKEASVVLLSVRTL